MTQTLHNLTAREVTTIAEALSQFATPAGQEVSRKRVLQGIGVATETLSPTDTHALISRINEGRRRPIKAGDAKVYIPLQPTPPHQVSHAGQYVVVLSPADGPDGFGRTIFKSGFRVRAGDGWEVYATRQELHDTPVQAPAVKP
jgi:hypothetical protein